MTIFRLFPNKMAVTMVLFWVSLILSVIGSYASGEFTILHSPDSLVFTGYEQATESSLKEIFSASLGLSVEENSKWSCLKITDPFNTPEAAVEVYVDGVSSLGDVVHTSKLRYPLKVDEYEPDTPDAMNFRIKHRFNGSNNKLVNVKLSNINDLALYFEGLKTPELPKKTSFKHLKLNVLEDEKFIFELETLKAVAERIKSGVVSADNVIDFYYFRFRSLHNLLDYHGPNSPATKEAKKLLVEALEELSQAFVKAYDGSVLFTVVTTDVAHTRRIRAAKAIDDQDSPMQQENMEYYFYPEDYAAIFNIFLWFGIIFVFTLIAIVYAMIDMDPGRDSIIYRMTSTRIKKEN